MSIVYSKFTIIITIIVLFIFQTAITVDYIDLELTASLN